MRTKASPARIQRARKLRDRGYTLEQLAATFKVSRRTIYAWLDDSVAERDRERQRRKREQLEPVYKHEYTRSSKDLKEEARRQQKLIPEDTRTLTGRFFGDPIPNDPRRRR